jgi:hypothetical protein
MDAISANLSVPDDWSEPAAFRRVIDYWRETAPELLPTRASPTEPVRGRFDPDDLGPTMHAWSEGIWLATRQQPRLNVTMLGVSRFWNAHLGLSLSVRHGGLEALGSLRRLVQGLAEEWHADYGMVHLLTDAELLEAQAQRRPDLLEVTPAGEGYLSTGFTRRMHRGLPTLYWWNWFGPRYEAVLGTDRLLGASWAQVERHKSGLACSVSTEPPSEGGWPAFRLRRERIVHQLGRDAFYPSPTRYPTLLPYGQPDSPTREIR